MISHHFDGRRPKKTFDEIMSMTPDELDEVVEDLHATDEPDEDLIGWIGVGQLENTLQDSEEEVWGRLQQLAREDERFRRALSSVWAFKSPMYPQRVALLRELGETEEIPLRFVVQREGFGKDERYRISKLEAIDAGPIKDPNLAALLREIADWLNRGRTHDRAAPSAP